MYVTLGTRKPFSVCSAPRVEQSIQEQRRAEKSREKREEQRRAESREEWGRAEKSREKRETREDPW